MASKILLIGYGNPGRMDDGLGPACAEAVAELGLSHVTVDADYQLTVEDAAAVAEHDVVIFADAAVRGREPFAFREIAPGREIGFTTHSVEPESVLGLAKEVFRAGARGFTLAIRGYRFEGFGETLSDGARENLQAAVRFLAGLLASGDFGTRAAGGTGGRDEAHVFSITKADLN